MSLFHILVLAVVQGLTEFLPVSSSGHLILLSPVTGIRDQGLVMDVAVHVGTLFAVVIYFWSDVKTALTGLGHMARRQETRESQLAICLILATIPVVIVGLIVKLSGLDQMLRSVVVIGWSMLIFGLVLYWADRTGHTEKSVDDWNLRNAFMMGLAQCLALIPGTSRSGITITAARRMGYGREGAARLAMLMSIPTIAASGVLLGLDVIGEADWAQVQDAALGAAFAFVAALLALSLMMRLLRSVSFTPYVIYRVLLGIALLIYAYS